MCNVVSSLCGNFSKIISFGSGFLIRKLPLGCVQSFVGNQHGDVTCNIVECRDGRCVHH